MRSFAGTTGKLLRLGRSREPGTGVALVTVLPGTVRKPNFPSNLPKPQLHTNMNITPKIASCEFVPTKDLGAALKACPWAFKAIAFEDGAMCFASPAHYLRWKSQSRKTLW